VDRLTESEQRPTGDGQRTAASRSRYLDPQAMLAGVADTFRPSQETPSAATLADDDR
jgi:hypothetical protein